jgi:non-specific serine/threonine protein kinase
VFAGGWTLEAAEHVCAAPEVEASGLLGLLIALVDKSVVWVEEHAGQARYHMLETMRQYGVERLQEAGETAAVQQRHRDWYLSMAQQAALGLMGADEGAWLGRLETEHDNLRAALTWTMAQEDAADTGVQFVVALWRFWAVRGHWGEGRRWLESALARSTALAPALRAQALYSLGRLAEWQDDYATARAYFGESLALCRAVGDTAGIATALNQLGTLALFCGEYRVARPLFEESLALRQAFGAPWEIAESLCYLGRVLVFQGDDAVGQAMLAESLTRWRALGYMSGMAEVLTTLGQIAYHHGAYATARARLAESLALRRALGAPWGMAHTLNNLGRVAVACEEYGVAGTLYEESLALCRALGDKLCAASSLQGLGMVAGGQREYQAARARVAESLALRRDLGDQQGIAECLEALAGIASIQAQPQRAARLWGVAEALREALGAPLLSSDRMRYDCAVARVRTVLDAATWTTAWTAGRTMPLEQAIVYALEASSSSPA